MWIDAWRKARAGEPKPIPALDEAARRLIRNDDLLDEPLARKLAELGTRAVPGGYVWKHDPLHATAGPYPFRLDVAESFWRHVTAPVLVVDGHATNRHLLEEMLLGWRMVPTLAASVPDALAALRVAQESRRPFKLVLAKVQMAGADGFTLAEAVKQVLYID